MATKNNDAQDPEVIIESALGRSEQFIEKHGKTMLIVLIVVVLCVSGYFGYKHLIQAPRMEKAANALYLPQQQFERDSFALALPGFEAVISEFGGTVQGNLARHYAGICCLYTKNYGQAIEYFSQFSNLDGAAGELISAQNYGMMGDSYVELKDLAKGVVMYEKAAAYSKNSDTAPLYLKKAALVNESLGNNTKALEQYKAIRSDYSQTMIARDIDKFIARVEQSL